MKMTAILLLTACLQVSAAGWGQTITLAEKNASLEKIFSEIRKQTGYEFLFNSETLAEARKVKVKVKNASVEDVLNICLKDQPFSYVVRGKTIVITPKPVETRPEPVEAVAPPPITIRGRIINEKGEPVVASIVVKGTRNGTTSNADGYYELNNADEKAILLITGVNIEPLEIKVNAKTTIDITAKIKVVESDEIVVAYNKTTVQIQDKDAHFHHFYLMQYWKC